MGIRRIIATLVAVAGAACFGYGVFGMETTGDCFVTDSCPVPEHVMVAAFAGGMVVALLATVAGAGAFGFGLVFLAPGLGSVYALLSGHPNPVAYVFAVVFTLVGLAGLGVGGFGVRWDRTVAQLKATGRDGVGTVLSVRDTGTTVNDNPRVRLRLRVTPADESAPFERDVALLVSRVAVPRPGDRYPVKYDPADRRRTITVGDALPPGDPQQPGPSPSGDTVIDQLTKLDALRRSGALTEEEFRAHKARLLDG